jgi:hypothetical protein
MRSNSRAKAVMSEAERSKTGATPLEAKGRKQARGADRPLKKQKLPANVSKAGRKLSAERMERMQIFLDSMSECPVISDAAMEAGIHPKTPQYWKECSEAGKEGYDIEWRGEIWRYHEHLQAAIEEARDKILSASWKFAMGPYRKDEYGTPIPMNARKVDKMLRFLAETMLPEKYGKRRKIDVPHHCGVLKVGGADTHKPNSGSAASVEARKWKAAKRMIGETEA